MTEEVAWAAKAVNLCVHRIGLDRQLFHFVHFVRNDTEYLGRQERQDVVGVGCVGGAAVMGAV